MIPWGITIVNTFILAMVTIPTLFFIKINPSLPLTERFVFNPYGYALFVIFLAFIFFSTEVLMIRNFVKASSSDRLRLGYLIAGTIFAGSLGILLNLVLPWTGNFSFFPSGPIFVTIFFTGAGLYTLLRHQLFNIRVIAAEIFVILLVITFSIRLILSSTSSDLSLNAAVLALAVGFGILLIRAVIKEVRDKEQIAKLAEKLEAANEELKKLDQAKSEFISIASHQLRAPLTVIRGYVAMLLEGSYGEITDKGKETKPVLLWTE